MKISFLGYYGSNFGDLLMLNALIDYYSPYYSLINIFTYGDKESLVKSFALNPNLDKIKIFSLAGSEKINYNLFLKSVKESKYIIWGGGTCFMDQGGTGGVKYVIGAYIANVPALYLGIGIDSHRNFKTKLYVFLAGLFSKALYLRDNESLNIANKLTLNLFKNKIKYVPDIANVKSVSKENKFSEDFIVFCCRDLSSYSYLNNDKVNLELYQLAVTITKRLNVKKVVNLICDAEIDIEQSNKANQFFLENDILVSSVLGSRIEDSLTAINESKFVLTSRLHPAVVSQNFNIPYALYDYSDKNKKFVLEVNEESRLIDRYKISNYVPDFNEPFQEDLKSKQKMITDVLQNYIK